VKVDGNDLLVDNWVASEKAFRKTGGIA
jgi:hypothetical protein